MSVSILGDVITAIAAGAATSIQSYARARQNARIISYLEDMPAYLRNDIGLPADADIRCVVETGHVSAADACGRRHNLAIAPHAT